MADIFQMVTIAIIFLLIGTGCENYAGKISVVNDYDIVTDKGVQCVHVMNGISCNWEEYNKRKNM